MRLAAQMFEPEELERLCPRRRGGPRLGRGERRWAGRRSTRSPAPRPSPTTSWPPAASTRGRSSRWPSTTPCTGGRGTLADGAAHVAQIPDAVKRMALAIEIFHKASLVHDDIEDDDAVRYGRPTLHQKYGLATAINVGDYPDRAGLSPGGRRQ